MISYYKFNELYFKLDAQKTFFQQVNNLINEKTIVHGGTSTYVENLHIAKDRDAWTVITEEEYNLVKNSVLDYLSVN